VSCECRLSQHIQLHGANGESIDTWLVLSEVVDMHISKELLKESVYDTAAARPILRGGGPAA
jgi:flavin reductase (DIM6/NTAB) family NADH-FMN oxidoreductase RutF